MARICNAEGRRTIEVLVSIGVDDCCAVRRFPEDRKIVGKIGNVALLVSSQLPRERGAARAGNAHVSSPIQRTNSAMRALPP